MHTHTLSLSLSLSLSFTYSLILFFSPLFALSHTHTHTLSVRLALCVQNVKVHVAALVNDTVGTLLAQAEYDSETAVGLILGTGTNACYVERIAKVPCEVK